MVPFDTTTVTVSLHMFSRVPAHTGLLEISMWWNNPKTTTV
jgi:hypothetical protein